MVLVYKLHRYTLTYIYEYEYGKFLFFSGRFFRFNIGKNLFNFFPVRQEKIVFFFSRGEKQPSLLREMGKKNHDFLFTEQLLEKDENKITCGVVKWEKKIAIFFSPTELLAEDEAQNNIQK